MFIPIAIICFVMFGFYSALWVPVAYVTHVIRLGIQILKNDSESKFCDNLCLFIQFLIVGPLLLVFAWFIDLFSFIYNLYTVPPQDKLKEQETTYISL